MRNHKESEQKSKMPKYHPYLVCVCLGVIGIFMLVVCLIVGIVLTQWIGEILKVPANSTDFIGGALGLTVGFVLDKVCIEKINQVLKYRALMEALKDELEAIKKVVYISNSQSEELYTINTTKDEYNEGDKIQYSGDNISSYKIISEEDSKGDEKADKRKSVVALFSGERDDKSGITTSSWIYNFNVEDLNNGIKDSIDQADKKDLTDEDIKKKGHKTPLEEMEEIVNNYTISRAREFILDDVVQNAETTSLIITLPFGKKYRKELINQLGYAQNYLEQFNDEKITAINVNKNWLLLQYYINNAIEMTGVRK